MNNSVGTHTIVIVGHPRDTLIERRLKHFSSAPDKIILIDALTQPATLPPALSAAEHIPAVVSQTAGEVELLRYAFGNMASQTPPTAALTALFPGLSIKSRDTVPTLSASEFTKLLQKTEGRITLWLDQFDSEMTVLEAAFAEELLATVEAIELTCGVEAFFEDSSTKKTLEDFLTAQGFELAHTDTSDPDWPALRFEQDLQQKALTKAYKDIADLSSKLAAAESELTKNQQELTQERASVSRLQADITDLKSAASTADTSRQVAEEASAKSLETLQNLQAELERLKTEADANKQAHDETQRKATETTAELNAKVETITAALAERDKKITDLSNFLDRSDSEQEAKLAAAESELTKKQQELTQERASVSRLEADITDLKSASNTADTSRQVAEEASAKSLETLQNLQAELERLKTEAEANKQAHDETQRKATETTAELNVKVETITAALAERDKRITDLSKRLRASEAGQSEETQRIEANYQITRHDLSLALASLSQQRADNETLQQKHEALFAEKRQLEALLAELTPRLREAAQQLQLLTVQDTNET